jgi:hypothetical protein
MRKAILSGFGTALLVPGPAMAAIPLHIQQRDELRRIIFLPELDRLGPIDRIERVGRGWRVTAGRCTVEIHIVERRLRPGMPGYGRIPPTYEPRAAAPVCRR